MLNVYFLFLLTILNNIFKPILNFLRPAMNQTTWVINLLKYETTIESNVENNYIIKAMFAPCIWITKLTSILVTSFHNIFFIPGIKLWIKSLLHNNDHTRTMTKFQMKNATRNKYKIPMRTLMLISSIPQFDLANDITLSNNLNAFVNTNGVLQTNKLPNHLINDLRALINDNKFESMVPTSDIQTGIIDSGSSIICTSFKDDFLPETLKPLAKQKRMNGIAGGLLITHVGITNYQTIDTRGRICKIHHKAYLVPGLPFRLIPP